MSQNVNKITAEITRDGTVIKQHSGAKKIFIDVEVYNISI